jgi:hypothetical protein
VSASDGGNRESEHAAGLIAKFAQCREGHLSLPFHEKNSDTAIRATDERVGGRLHFAPA